MFGKSKEPSFGTETKMKISTIIGEGAIFDGNFSAPDSMRIDGTVNGNCRCEKELILGPSATVEGNIFAQNVMISGKVNGDIFANGKLELLSTGRILGNISAKSLVIDENASFDGRCTMTTMAPQNVSDNNTVSTDTVSEAVSTSASGKNPGSSAEETPLRDFVRISAEPVETKSKAEAPADEASQSAPARPKSTRASKTTASQNSM